MCGGGGGGGGGGGARWAWPQNIMRLLCVVIRPDHFKFASYTPGGFFFWTRFENLVAKRRKINDRVVPILVAIRIGMTSYACQDLRKSLSLPSVLLLAV